MVETQAREEGDILAGEPRPAFRTAPSTLAEPVGDVGASLGLESRPFNCLDWW